VQLHQSLARLKPNREVSEKRKTWTPEDMGSSTIRDLADAALVRIGRWRAGRGDEQNRVYRCCEPGGKSPNQAQHADCICLRRERPAPGGTSRTDEAPAADYPSDPICSFLDLICPEGPEVPISYEYFAGASKCQLIDLKRIEVTGARTFFGVDP